MRIQCNTKLFIKSFSITLTVVAILFFSGWMTVRGFVKPPEIPKLQEAERIAVSIENQNIDLENIDLGDIAHMPFDLDEKNIYIEDMHIGNGLYAPESFTDDDRKELFYTFLIIGMDGGVNTDTIMVASYDGVNREANIIGIPRDSMVNVKRSIKKINAAYAVGTLYGGGMMGGINQLKREIKTIIGFVPDFYICIDYDVFTSVIDSIGGVDVYVPYDMIYDDPHQGLHTNLRKGNQTLNGENALKFARYRKGNNSKNNITDYQRIENQQTLINAMLTKLLNPSNMLKIPEFISLFNENVHSDIKMENMLWFASEMNKIRGTDMLSMHTMPTKGTSGSPLYYEYLDKTAIVELVNKTINPYVNDIRAEDLDIIS